MSVIGRKLPTLGERYRANCRRNSVFSLLLRAKVSVTQIFVPFHTEKIRNDLLDLEIGEKETRHVAVPARISMRVGQKAS